MTLSSEAPLTRPAVPGPKGHPLVGSLREFRSDALGTIYRAFREHGDLVHLRLGPRQVYVASHPELAQEILVNRRQTFAKLHRPNGQKAGLQLVLGNGLVTNANEAHWLVQRRMIQPIFHRQQVAAMGEKMTAAGERMLARWQEAFRPGQTIDISAEMMQVTLDIINCTMFSADVSDKARQIGPAVKTAAQFAFNYETSPLTPPLSWPTPANRRFRAALQLLDEVILEIIEARRRSGREQGDLLDMLLAAQDEETGRGMSNEQLRDEVLTIFAAGHETTANALTWTWYLLSQHWPVAERLQAEVDEALQGRSPTIADLERLPYTRAVLDESMRILSPVPLTPRLIMEDTELGGYTLPARERILVCMHNIHHHPEFWQEPEVFRPERFLPGGTRPAHRLAYMPFGAGPRLCIGNHMALTEGVILLALIAQHYNLELAPGHQVVKDLAITLHPRDGLMMTLQLR